MELIDGKKVAENYRGELKEKILKLWNTETLPTSRLLLRPTRK